MMELLSSKGHVQGGASFLIFMSIRIRSSFSLERHLLEWEVHILQVEFSGSCGIFVIICHAKFTISHFCNAAPP